MSYATSIQSTTGTIATYAKKFVQNGKPEMDIIFDNHDEGKIYTTFDALSGRVEITASHNARFDEIQITLEGSTKVWVENLSPHSTRARTTARHNFLKLAMPIQESDYPQPRIAEAGRTYTFPFNFVIPDQLLPKACNHKHAAEHIHHEHTRLPPSMGDREVSRLDDLTPAMAQVTYGIRVKVIRQAERDETKSVLTEGFRKFYVVPAVAEAPPMNTDLNNDYRLARMKVLRKGVFSGKLGKVHVSAAQPGALILHSPSSGITTAPTTMATVKLRFDPRDKASPPPRLGGLSTKIKATTFFSARPAHDIPNHFTMMTQYETTRGVYDTSLNLSSRCVESVAWTKHKAAPAYTRRDSESSISSSDCCSDEANLPEPKEGNEYYTAEIIVPITLPQSKAWVPTFHSCVASRVYIIDMSLTIHTPGAGVPATTVTLHLPVQIAANGSAISRVPMTAAEAAAELADADVHLRPRVIEAPSPELIGNSVLAARGLDLPPSYEAFANSQPRQVVAPGRS